MGIKTRVIPVLLWDEHGCVKGKGFDKSRRIGSIHDRIRLLERRDIDELIILDVSQRAPRFEELKEITAPLFCPITVGGGVKSLGDIGRLLASGADKVAVNSAALERPAFVAEASRKFGAQAIVVAVNVHAGRVRTRSGMHETGWNCMAWAKEIEALGAGELLLTSVANDGMLDGFELDLIERVASAVDIPVIACGGCGSYEHMKQALDAGAHAVAAGAMFQFREATPKGAARFLHDQGFQVRL